MSRRLFLLECSAPHWIQVSRLLALEKVEVVHWTAWYRLAEEVRANFLACVFHDTLDAKRALRPDGSRAGSELFDDACEDVWRRDAQQVYDMMNRFDHSRDMSFVERCTLFYKYLVYWRSVLREARPDMVVFAAPPHVVYDYVVLCLCRKLGIRTLMFEEIPIAPPFSLSMSDYRGHLHSFVPAQPAPPDDGAQLASLHARLTGGYERGAPARELVARADMKTALAEGREGLIARVKVVSDLDNANSGRYDKNEKIVNTSSLYKEKGKSLQESFEGDYANTRFMNQMLADQSVTQELYDFYHAQATDPGAITGKKFIYFPLAGQPERTSNPQADIFTNQLLVANLLAHSVPADWIILVKEHPNQFHPNFAVNMCRSVDYYQTLLGVPRVVVVPSMSDSFDLIDRASLVATTGGTAAMEAIARLKPVLLFGDAWYRDCPGIRRVHSLADVRSFMESFLRGEVAVRPGDFLAYMSSMTRKGFRGIADYPAADFNVDEQENVENLVRIVLRELT